MADMNSVPGNPQEGAASPMQQAKDISAAAAKTTDAALSSMGESLSALAGAIREHVPQDGALGTAASGVADRLESGGQYLAQQGLNGIVEDVSALVRKHPLPAIGVALGIGWLLGAYSRRS